MANTYDLSALTEVIYAARDQVAREQVGFLPSVTINGGSERVSKGGTVQSLRSVKPTLNTTHTPAMTPPAGDDVTPQSDTMVIDQVANVRIPMTGESAFKLNNTGAGRTSLQNTFAQSIRVMVNAIEAHVGQVAYRASSRAAGSAGTTPFADDFKIINSIGQILRDNGCPFDGQNSLVINSVAGTNLRNLTTLTKANEAGSTDTLRQGTLLDIGGFMIKESAGISAHTKGTANGAYDVNLLAGYGVGDRSIAVDTGAGTILAGDVITFAGDTNKYVVNQALADGVLVIGHPGLRQPLADGVDLTLGNSYSANVGFHRTAIELVMRPPAMPDGGDAAVDRMTIYDEVSGLTFDIAVYLGYGMNMFDITCYYQAKVWKPEFVATLLG